MDNLPTNRQSARRAFWISAGLHIALFLTVLCTALFTPPPPPQPRTLIVRTVALKPGSVVRMAAAPKARSSAPKAQGPVSKQEEPPPAPPKPAEEIVAEKEPEGTSEEPHNTPQNKENEEPAPAQKASAPSPKASPKAAVTTKAPPTKPSNSSKGATPDKKGPAKGSATNSKTTAAKGKSASKESTSTQKSSAPQYDQNLLSDALRRLDRSKSAAAKGSGSSGNGSGGSPVGTSGGTARVGTVGALNVDSDLVISTGSNDGDEAYEGYATASPEACYIGDLIRRLQLNVRLPEPGEVRVKLSLKRNGAISSIQVLSGSKPSIKQAIEKKLKAVHFSPFGTSFSGEPEHIFNLRLSNDLIWSCR